MNYRAECQLGLHLYSIITNHGIIELLKNRKYHQNQRHQQTKNKVVPAIENQRTLFYLYGNLNLFYPTKQQAIQASQKRAIQLCTYPEKYLKNNRLTTISLDEMICQQHHIQYSNPDIIVKTVLTYLGDETIPDRLNYAQYLKRYDKNEKDKLTQLHHKYYQQGMKRLKKTHLLK